MSTSQLQSRLQAILKKAGPANQPEWLGLRELIETTTVRAARNGKPDRNHSHTTAGIMVEVLSGGQFGYAATTSSDESALQDAFERASNQAKQAAKWGVVKLTGSVRPSSQGTYRSPLKKRPDQATGGELAQLLVKVTEKLKVSPKVVRTDAFLQIVECHSKQVSSSGADIEQDYVLLSTDFSATAQDGAITQRRSDGDNWQSGLEMLDQPGLWERVERIGGQAVELLSAEDCPTETTALVLPPSQMTLQIHESIGHPLELDRILGDERNYAGWSFVRPQDFGKLRYGSPIMNVTFDPTVEGEFASYAFDDGANPATRQFLIRDGILERGLGGLESQQRLSLPGVANFRASSWNRPAVDRMANLNLEPGDSSFQDIISGVERGILMRSNRSWSIDDYRNKFQFGCEYAQLIENGKLTKTLKNPNYRGVTTPFWNGLKKVGNASTLETHGTPNCGKAEPNQVIRVGHRSPVCLFEGVEVFGGSS